MSKVKQKEKFYKTQSFLTEIQSSKKKMMVYLHNQNRIFIGINIIQYNFKKMLLEIWICLMQNENYNFKVQCILFLMLSIKILAKKMYFNIFDLNFCTHLPIRTNIFDFIFYFSNNIFLKNISFSILIASFYSMIYSNK